MSESPQLVLELTEKQKAVLGEAAQRADIQPVHDFSDVESILLLAHRVLGRDVPEIKDIVVGELTDPKLILVHLDQDDIWISNGYSELDEFQGKNRSIPYYIAIHVVRTLIDIRNHIVKHLVDRGFRL